MVLTRSARKATQSSSHLTDVTNTTPQKVTATPSKFCYETPKQNLKNSTTPPPSTVSRVLVREMAKLGLSTPLPSLQSIPTESEPMKSESVDQNLKDSGFEQNESVEMNELDEIEEICTENVTDFVTPERIEAVKPKFEVVGHSDVSTDWCGSHVAFDVLGQSTVKVVAQVNKNENPNTSCEKQLDLEELNEEGVELVQTMLDFLQDNENQHEEIIDEECDDVEQSQMVQLGSEWRGSHVIYESEEEEGGPEESGSEIEDESMKYLVGNGNETAVVLELGDQLDQMEIVRKPKPALNLTRKSRGIPSSKSTKSALRFAW
uniref:Uncharacterized protein n=1 Tax=Timspurckia oligopyrenoides TaxID=708627 RepID=A0A6T6MQN5_9RHOD|mmetsp:Transcript_5239/g.9164  ORF Transcript_5239/g.9164 Transcript_5239/m.9164 type:complete len:319 (+) Transcript_5239:254-1210(+)